MTFEQAIRLVRGNQGGLLIDTNALLLWLAGQVDPALVGEWKRTQDFLPEHFEITRALVQAARKLVTTPHVLAETWNFGEGFPRRTEFDRVFRAFVERAREKFNPTKSVVGLEFFDRLGVTDSIIGSFTWSTPVVLTTDALLVGELEKRRKPVCNPSHYVLE